MVEGMLIQMARSGQIQGKVSLVFSYTYQYYMYAHIMP